VLTATHSCSHELSTTVHLFQYRTHSHAWSQCLSLVYMTQQKVQTSNWHVHR